MPRYRLRAEQTIALEIEVEASDVESAVRLNKDNWDQWNIVNIGNPRDYRIVDIQMPASDKQLRMIPLSDEHVMVVEWPRRSVGEQVNAKVVATLKRG